jgi:hypothetical protein
LLYFKQFIEDYKNISLKMALSYNGKCEHCGKEHPSISVPVRLDRGDGIGPLEHWCLKCLDAEISKQQILDR